MKSGSEWEEYLCLQVSCRGEERLGWAADLLPPRAQLSRPAGSPVSRAGGSPVFGAGSSPVFRAGGSQVSRAGALCALRTASAQLYRGGRKLYNNIERLCHEIFGPKAFYQEIRSVLLDVPCNNLEFWKKCWEFFKFEIDFAV